MRSFHIALVGFSNHWIHFICRGFNWVSVSKISNPLPPNGKSWARCIGGHILFRSRGNYILFQFSFCYILEQYILDIYSLDKRIWFTIIFLPLKDMDSRYEFFYYTFIYFVSIGVIEDRTTKINSLYFNGAF